MSRMINKDILIAYTHDMLDAPERAEVEAALHDSPALLAELEAIRRLQRDLHATLTIDAANPVVSDATWTRIAQRIEAATPGTPSSSHPAPIPQPRWLLFAHRLWMWVADRFVLQPGWVHAWRAILLVVLIVVVIALATRPSQNWSHQACEPSKPAMCGNQAQGSDGQAGGDGGGH